MTLITLQVLFFIAVILIEIKSNSAQLAHDIVTTLGFGCILVAMSDNVVTMLSQSCVSNVVTTTRK